MNAPSRLPFILALISVFLAAVSLLASGYALRACQNRAVATKERDLSSEVLGGRDGPDASEAMETIRAHRIVLLNEEGREAVVIDAPGGAGRLRTYDEAGRELCRIGAGTEGHGSFMVVADEDRPLVEMSATTAETTAGYLFVHRIDGTILSFLGSSWHGYSGGLGVFGPMGEPAVMVATGSQGDESIMVNNGYAQEIFRITGAKEGSGAMRIYGLDRKTLFSVEEGDEETGMACVHDESGEASLCIVGNKAGGGLWDFSDQDSSGAADADVGTSGM